MLSKTRAWDYFQKSSDFTSLFKSNGLKGFVIDDPFVENIFKEKLPKKDLEFRIFLGNEISKSFLEEQFLNLSFFSTSQNLLILNAELMNADVLEFFLLEVSSSIESHVVLFFSKANKNISDLLKNSKPEFVEIEAPKPWEGGKLLSFFLKELHLNLSFELQKFLLENLEHNSESFYQAIKLIQLNYPDGNVDLNALKSLIIKERYDFFDLIDLYHRDRSKLLIAVSRKSQDFDWFRQFSSSMQGHLTKVLFPEELSKKDKLTKYDQGILAFAEKENRHKLKSDLNLFSELEIMAKSKDEFLKDKIRLEILK